MFNIRNAERNEINRISDDTQMAIAYLKNEAHCTKRFYYMIEHKFPWIYNVLTYLIKMPYILIKRLFANYYWKNTTAQLTLSQRLVKEMEKI
ncbi:MAG: hypothetical protein Q8S21_06345 [Candidatus Paracaedibacteraceae bacterium]|nr:hypothetical protein [Candidatus Paracaedibacteraceae bacterium]